MFEFFYFLQKVTELTKNLSKPTFKMLEEMINYAIENNIIYYNDP